VWGVFVGRFCWTVAIEWRLDGGSSVMIWVGAAIMKWRSGSIPEKKLREEMNGVLERKRSGGLFWGRSRRIFEEEKLGRREFSRVSNLPLRLTES
jgi:hypothetical protein